jgi:hypothetical protein
VCAASLILVYRLAQSKRIGWLPRLPNRKRDSRHQASRYKPPRIARTRCAMDIRTDTRMRTGTSLPVTRPHRTRPRPMLPLLPHILNRPAPTGTFLSLLRALSVRRLDAGRTERHNGPYATPTVMSRSDNMYLTCILSLPYLPCSPFGLVYSLHTESTDRLSHSLACIISVCVVS